VANGLVSGKFSPGLNLQFRHCSAFSFQKISTTKQGRNEGVKGWTIPQTSTDSEGRKKSQQCHNYFNSVH